LECVQPNSQIWTGTMTRKTAVKTAEIKYEKTKMMGQKIREVES